MPNNKYTKTTKEQFTHMLIGQILLIGVSVAALLLYIIPKWKETGKIIEEANASIESYENTYENGLKTEKILSFIDTDPKRSELYTLIKNNNEAVAKVIRKNGTEREYVQWLYSNLQDSKEDIRKLQIIKAKMNSIVPTLSPVTSTVDEAQISLKDYVEFVENNLLSKYKIRSESAISIDKITYAKDSENSPMGTIGYVDMNIQFEGENQNIYRFLDYIYKLGNPEILTQTKITYESMEQVPKAMENPLVTIESLTISDEIDIDEKKLQQNTGTIVLRFYIRGSTQDDANFLASEIVSRREKLQEKIETTVKICIDKKIKCEEIKINRLHSFDTKYNEFLRMSGTISIDPGKWASTSDVTQMAEQIKTLRIFNEEFEANFKSLIELQ